MCFLIMRVLYPQCESWPYVVAKIADLDHWMWLLVWEVVFKFSRDKKSFSPSCSMARQDSLLRLLVERTVTQHTFVQLWLPDLLPIMKLINMSVEGGNVAYKSKHCQTTSQLSNLWRVPNSAFGNIMLLTGLPRWFQRYPMTYLRQLP